MAALAIFWSVLELLINPIGDFPLNDDWAYALPVKDLLTKHQVRYPGWIAGSYVAQMFFGYPFCWLFGFSFTVLRFAGVTTGLVTVLATYGLLRQGAIGRATSFLCALTVALNPLVLQCANTFMTDVPFLAFTLVGLFVAVRGLRCASGWYALVALALTVVATLIRQPGIFVAPAVLGGLLLIRHASVRRSVAVLLAGVVVFSSLALYEAWLRKTHQMPEQYGQQGREIVDAFKQPELFRTKFGGWAGFRDRIHSVFVYLGTFLLPVILVVLARRREQPRWIFITAWTCAVVFAVDAIENLLVRGWLMPFLFGYNLFNWGLGPVTLVDTFTFNQNLDLLPHAPEWVLRGVTAIGILGGAAVVFLFTRTALHLLVRQIQRRTWSDLPAAIGVLFTIVYGMVLAFQFSYDRYLIPLFPVLVLVLSWKHSGNPRRGSTVAMVAAGGSLLVIGAFSVGATHDYLAWNRARWVALNQLTSEQGVSPDNIDGGFEFNGKHEYEARFEFGLNFVPGKSWWWVADDQYRVTFGPMEGYQTIAARDFQRWMPPGTGRILTLKRQTPLPP